MHLLEDFKIKKVLIETFDINLPTEVQLQLVTAGFVFITQ